MNPKNVRLMLLSVTNCVHDVRRVRTWEILLPALSGAGDCNNGQRCCGKNPHFVRAYPR